MTFISDYILKRFLFTVMSNFKISYFAYKLLTENSLLESTVAYMVERVQILRSTGKYAIPSLYKIYEIQTIYPRGVCS